MATKNRRTWFPGSGPSNNPMPSRGTAAGDEGSVRPQGQRRLFTSRQAPYSIPSAHATKGTRKSRPTPPLHSPVSEEQLLREFPGRSSDDPSHTDGSEAAALKKQRSDRHSGTSPRPTYHEFMNLEQAGPAVMGCDNTRERNLVAIKRLRGVDKISKHMMRPFISDQVVSVQDMFCEKDGLVIIYERMDVSLRQVTGILQGTLEEFQIAAICKELVGGLAYIHGELSLYHGNLNCSEVILNLDGMVKIANIGESFARNKSTTTENKRKDVQSIGFVMMELMEPTTYMLDPQSTELQTPGKWNDDSRIKDFLGATQHQSLEHLRNHDFLPKEPLAKCLRAHVYCAMWAAGTKWDILSLP